MSHTEVEAKYRKLAMKLLPAQHVDELAERVWRLEELDDVSAILRLTVIPD